ncbi:MAG: hypothetical protein HOW97_34025 [Catenulispora sp.]|nr:hypothetical protein [Catenulispora sp.]
MAGSREHPRPETVGPRIGELALSLGGRPLIVRHGACPGPTSVDQAADDWIRACGDWLGVTADPMAADWDHCGPDCPTGRSHRRRKKPGDIWHPGVCDDYCPGAGPRRNAGMVLLGADGMYAWPAGASYGTRNCMRLAKRAGIPVRRWTA